jgi:hypothetical protein
MDICFEIEIAACTVGFLTTSHIPKWHPQSVVFGIALVRLERNGLPVNRESKLSPSKIVLLASGTRSDCYRCFVLVLVERQFESILFPWRIVIQTVKRLSVLRRDR